ncbi:MAG: hypothetical protein OXC02_03750 [Rhodobacteraceae bacterium]|nr:hypothetical protein [Paracoccaceae bacterium]
MPTFSGYPHRIGVLSDKVSKSGGRTPSKVIYFALQHGGLDDI